MPRQFYTERDIVDMARGGVMSLEVTDNVVLTELAYEKARVLGITLVQVQPDNPPCAPVRPYLSSPRGISPSEPGQHDLGIRTPSEGDALAEKKPGGVTLEERIRNAVVARLGPQVDANLLEVIIRRVLNSTGAKEPSCCSAESGAAQYAPLNTPALKA